MPNPGGANQLGGYQIQPGYGDVKRQTELIREAPMSGAPTSGRALGAARSDQKRAVRGNPQATPAQPGQPAPAPPMPPAQISPQQFAFQAWQQIAQIPGASPLVQQYAARAVQSGAA